MSREIQTAITLGFVLLLPGAKWLQLERWPDQVAVRQLVLIVVLLAVLSWVHRGRTWDVAVRRQVLTPREDPATPQPNHAQYVALGIAATVAAVASAALIIAAGPMWSVWLAVLASLVPVAGLVAHEVLRMRSMGRAAWLREDHAVLWTVAPGVSLWCGIIGFGLIRGSFIPLAGQTLILDGETGSALYTVIVVALGEEYLFRGLLLVLAMSTALRHGGRVALSVSFALWHLPDEWGGSVLTIGLTIVAMFLASYWALYPLRRLGRSLASPTLLHAANNLALRLVV